VDRALNACMYCPAKRNYCLGHGTQGASDDLEPIETASRDEITALQLSRLKWSGQHAYDTVRHFRAAFDARGVHPNDLKALSDLALFPFTRPRSGLREQNDR
jgi:phenylacetate-CoA ligase